MYKSVLVVIVRNLGTTPLPESSWDLFRADVRAAIISAGRGRGATAFYLDTEGTGYWKGVKEENRVFHAANDGGFHAVKLRRELAVLARIYGQQAIACTFARESGLVNAATVDVAEGRAA